LAGVCASGFCPASPQIVEAPEPQELPQLTSGWMISASAIIDRPKYSHKMLEYHYKRIQADLSDFY